MNIESRLGHFAGALAGQRAFIGFDACLDTLFLPVQHREGAGSDYDVFPDIRSFGEHISNAEGKSCCIEVVRTQRKIGGNGPILATALSGTPMGLTCVGPFGQPEIDPVFAPLARRARLLSIGRPAATSAYEFDDGKVMLSELETYETIDDELLRRRVGRRRLREEMEAASLVACVNWSCLPGMTRLLEWILDDIPPRPGEAERLYFFDLADLSRRGDEAVSRVLALIGRFRDFGRVALGLNLGEALRVGRVLYGKPPAAESRLDDLTLRIAERLPGVDIVVHATRRAAFAGPSGRGLVDGVYCEKPVISTGAGDHFNAGLCAALCAGATPEEALRLGVCYSGYYVARGGTPDLHEMADVARESTLNPVDTT